MLRTTQESTDIVMSENRQVAECLGALYSRSIGRAALVGSQAARFAALTLAVPGIALPDDWDLQVVPDDFEAIAQYTKAEVERNKQIDTLTGDGKRMRFIADDARARIGGATLQFMRIHHPVCVDGREFNTSFTDDAFAMSQQHGPFHFAHDVETLTLYGLRQGNYTTGKHDLVRAAVVRATRDPFTDTYAQQRAQQIGWDFRLHAFANRAATMATSLQAVPILIAA
jgi:Arc/MetJ family transcription regulator